MDAALALVIFAPALALGSFLNVVAARLPEGRSLVRPRSACGSCGAEIAWYDNIPVVSYFMLRGRCRACGETFSARYPAVEIATAVLVAACFWHFGLTGEAVVGAYFCATLVVLSAIDAERRILPDLIVLPSFVIVLAANLILAPDRWKEWLGASLAASLFLFLALVAYPRGMGMGDVKLAGAMGLYLGLSIIPALLIAFLTGSIVGLVIIAREGPAARKKAVPFGVFLAIGGIAGVLVGPDLVDVYKTTFLE
jgi:leader peptidase (prepilin peptidase) / N-methyltransferase